MSDFESLVQVAENAGGDCRQTVAAVLKEVRHKFTARDGAPIDDLLADMKDGQDSICVGRSQLADAIEAELVAFFDGGYEGCAGLPQTDVDWIIGRVLGRLGFGIDEPKNEI